MAVIHQVTPPKGDKDIFVRIHDGNFFLEEFAAYVEQVEPLEDREHERQERMYQWRSRIIAHCLGMLFLPAVCVMLRSRVSLAEQVAEYFHSHPLCLCMYEFIFGLMSFSCAFIQQAYIRNL